MKQIGRLLLVAAVLAATAPTLAAELGRVHVRLGDLDVDSRSAALEDGELLRTYSDRMVVHLDNGQVLSLASNTAALFEKLEHEAVKVRVLAGTVEVLADSGKTLGAGAGSWFVLHESFADPLAREMLLVRQPAPRGARR